MTEILELTHEKNLITLDNTHWRDTLSNQPMLHGFHTKQNMFQCI